MKERQVIVKNLQVNYKIFDRGEEPFLILHGWGSGSDNWKKVGELLAQNNFRVFIPDLPGFGKSQESKEVWGLDSYVEWLYGFCQEIKELNGSFYLLGHSFGGALASKFAIKYNQKVEKLFLVAPSGIREKTVKKKMLAKVSKFIKIFSFLPLYDVTRKVFYRVVVGGNDYTSAKGMMRENFLKVVSEDLSQCLSFIKVPTVIIWGDNDNLTPMLHADIFNKKIENSKLIIVPGAPHALQIVHPEILAEKILAQLNNFN